jgi:DNA-binding NarL/FixJ family response regulator
MPTTPRTGGAFLERKSAMAIARQSRPRFNDILIVEDAKLDAERLKATLHSIFGYDIITRHAPTLGSALDRVIERQPDLIFLDDHLKPNDNAAHTIPFLRRCNYAGPIIVVSGLLDRKRGAILIQAGAAVTIHKDSLDSGSIAEALAKIHEQPAGAAAGMPDDTLPEGKGSAGEPIEPVKAPSAPRK